MTKCFLWVPSILLLAAVSSSAQGLAEGKKIYTTYCATCHGDKGKGDGPAARALPVKAADHTNGAVMNPLTDKYLIDVISKGGAAVGKSPIMPAWATQFNEKQIRDIIAYIRSIAVPPYTADTK